MDLTAAAVVTGDEVPFPTAEENCKSVPVSVSPSVDSKTETVIKANDSDFELAQKAASGNMAAFERIYERYHRRTYSLCLRMTNSATEAEDLTQEVFIQLFRKIGSFRGESAFSTWLHRMTINQVLMHFRRRGVQNEKTTDDGEMPEQIVKGTENYNKMPILDRIAIDKAIAELPNGYRTVFVLHDVEGFEHEEIARMLGLSVGTSKSQLHKARLKLRGLLRKVTETKEA
ncbi:MAG TPA: RNA polymerase sigma factor [Pyrinomonadaceae bacterium]|nr:RNA polymerase sigma factor [Pyrinomonadaceae bacterium]